MPVGSRKYDLPLPAAYESEDVYIDDLLAFVTRSKIVEKLVQSVHVLDFFTRDPNLYGWAIEADWRRWFELHSLDDILDLFFREDLEPLLDGAEPSLCWWRGQSAPPPSLVKFLHSVRSLLLYREPYRELDGSHMPHHIATGMNVKKRHEVQNFTRYVDELSQKLAARNDGHITHYVDFGAGQNYLGRAMASSPYNKDVIAVEGKPHNVEGAKKKDVHAKIAPKQKRMVNKKEWKAMYAARKFLKFELDEETVHLTDNQASTGTALPYDGFGDAGKSREPTGEPQALSGQQLHECLDRPTVGNGSVQHVAHHLSNGDLSPVIRSIIDPKNGRLCNERESADGASSSAPRQLMTISIHSCGNLSHHGLRSLTLNDEVKAVAIIGCCYNLLTERLRSASYKHPGLRLSSSLKYTASDRDVGDPAGFPMSSRMVKVVGNESSGMRWNINARMLAVQAPQNWGSQDSDGFFTRHYFRALLQRMLLDYGVVQPPLENDDDYDATGGSNQPIVIGSLKKSAFSSFTSYVRAALERLTADKQDPVAVRIDEKTQPMTDEVIAAYDDRYRSRKKELSIVWALMSYTAGLVEASIVVDRWLWLKEQPEVAEAWVEPVWDYKQSPRNLVVVGIKM